MLAKASPAGRGFSGKIDYLYEGKLAERSLTEKQAKIIVHSENIRVPNSFEDTKTRDLMKADFINQAQSHRDYGKVKNSSYVGEHILSFTQEDRKQLNPKKLKEITTEYIQMAGLNNTQFVAISHHDTDNFHVHILFNRAMDNGKKYAAWKEQNKTIERGITLALKHGFKLVKNQKEIANSKEVIQLRSTMQDIKDLRLSNQLFTQARNLLHLEKLCEAKKMDFSKDEILRTVRVNNQTYNEADLKAVCLLNRNDSEKKKETKIENHQKNNFQSKQKESQEIEIKSDDLKLKKQAKPYENDDTKRLNKKKRAKGYQIKIEKTDKKKELKKGMGI